MSITLQYVDPTGTTYSNTYSRPLSNPGIDDADEVSFYPDVDIQRLLGGSYYALPPQVANRVITVDFGVIQNQSDRIFIFNFFFQKNDSGVPENYIVYNGETIQVEFDRKALKFDWINNISVQKSLILRLYEKTSWSSLPASWTNLTVTTSIPVQASSSTANGGGTVFGGAMVLVRGLCWDVSANPTTARSHSTDGGSGEGAFSSVLTGLSGPSDYHVRAYVTTATGTFYGNDVTFHQF